MSGTSGDGVSIALVDFKGRGFRLLGFKNFDYPAPLRRQLIRLGSSGTKKDFSIAEISRLNRTLGDFSAAKTFHFLKSLRVSFRKIAVMGSHGHTVYHGPCDPRANTFQI